MKEENKIEYAYIPCDEPEPCLSVNEHTVKGLIHIDWCKKVPISSLVEAKANDELVQAALELHEYLNETTFEKGKAVQLNTVGANSILHNNLAKALFMPDEVKAVEAKVSQEEMAIGFAEWLNENRWYHFEKGKWHYTFEHGTSISRASYEKNYMKTTKELLGDYKAALQSK